MPFFQKNRQPKNRLGYGFVFSQGMLLCVLLLINGFIVRSTINLNWGEEVRISQALQTVLPVLMIVLELWLYDFIVASTTKYKI